MTEYGFTFLFSTLAGFSLISVDCLSQKRIYKDQIIMGFALLIWKCLNGISSNFNQIVTSKLESS